ncbi:hypothetical protein JCM5353_007253 [Sporobolomyces roseus]
MPDEVLLLIFRNTYSDSHSTIFPANSLRIATLLVNKRISHLAQPIWFENLLISSTQLDLGLAILNSNKIRRRSIRHLDVPLSNLFYNILSSVLPRLPNLTSLTLRFANGNHTKAINTLADKVCSLRLKTLTLDSEGQRQPVEGFYARCIVNNLNPDTRVTLQYQDAPYYVVEGKRGAQQKKLLWSQEFAGPLLEFDWSDLASLELETSYGALPYPEALVGSLKASLANHHTIPLKRFQIDVYFPSDEDESDVNCFQTKHFKQLLQLLARTNLQRLGLSDLDLVPEPPEHLTMSNVETLELSGNCNLKKTEQFLRLYNLLSTMPALTRLRLIGSSFFGSASIANEMAKVRKLELNFRYPELCTLLDFLRQSRVLIFTSYTEANMSVHQTRSTSSNLIKQEEQGNEDLRGAPQLAQPPTSLLNLPDDILCMIMEEVYDERQTTMTTERPLEIAETLVNKRIFSLACPLWFRQLSINESQLDLRLAGLHMDDKRRPALRHLRVTLANAHSNILKSVLLRLPHLTYLSIQLPQDLRPQALTGLAAVIAGLDALEHINLEIADSTEHSAQLLTAYLDAKPGNKARLSVESKEVLYYNHGYQQGTGLWCLKAQPSVITLSRSTWPLMFALEWTMGHGNLLSWNDQILEGLQEALVNDVCSKPSATPTTTQD